MKTSMKLLLTLILFSILCIGIMVTVVIHLPAENNNETSVPSILRINTTIPGEKINGYAAPFGTFTIDAPVPNYSRSIRVYRGVFREGDSIDLQLQTIGKIRKNVTSPEEAPEVAKKVLEPYGGLPQDAIFEGASTSYEEKYNGNTDTVESRDPISTSVSYTRLIDGKWIIGDSNKILLELGENGELLWIYKVWRNYTYAGDVPIIPLDKAINKLRQGDTMESYADQPENVSIYMIVTGYYAKNVANNETMLEPVWMFYGKTNAGYSLGFNVYARQFANFTASPTSGKNPLTVTFTDTSDTSPNKWFWDFGDGTNSTEQSPAHTYTTAGTYNVSLKAWNDLGSDTMENPAYITVRNPAAPVANFTGTPITGTAPLNVTFTDISTNLPSSWLWDFGDGTNASVQNPTHTYSVPGNYTVSLNVTNDDGTNTITQPDYISVSNLPPTTLTTAPTTTVTTTAVTTTVTTTTTTTKPTPTRTHAPLSPVVAIVGIVVIGMFYAGRQKKKE